MAPKTCHSPHWNIPTGSPDVQGFFKAEIYCGTLVVIFMKLIDKSNARIRRRTISGICEVSQALKPSNGRSSSRATPTKTQD